ncbi:MAG: ABC transporter ATP-binding protein [Spirochaetes bacterium]|nr:ABC transporter ATP-binding protein [Spirochaetota bacterium]
MIEVHNLTQTYPSGRGVFDLDFTIEKGEVFGYLGPNGAGKTTTIRSLLGFTNPSRGSAAVNGIDCRRHPEQIQNMIGYLPGEIAFFEHMTGSGFLKFLENLRRTQAGSRKKEELINLFELDDRQKISKMSKGMKQKLGIVAAFMHDPDIYILDEPTSGLDPFMQNIFIDLLEQEKLRGKTIMLSSHIFEEVQRICSRAGIVREGRIVAIEDIAALNTMKQRTYTVTLGNEKDADILADSPLVAVKHANRQVLVTVGENYRELFTLLAKLEVTGFSSQQQSLEDVFMKYYGTEDSGTKLGGRKTAGKNTAGSNSAGNKSDGRDTGAEKGAGHE